MRKNALLVFVFLFSIVSINGFAEGEKKAKKKSLHDEFTGQGYGVAGCGLGSIFFGPKPGMIQVGVATTNGIYSNQAFGISTGTSNCDIPEMGLEAAYFIEANKEIVKKDAARGNGETLTNLAGLFECQNQDNFNQSIQTNYMKIFNSENDSFQSTREILKMIEADKNLNCHTS